MKTNKDKSKINKPRIQSSNTFPVVGIGASAGGLDAFKRLLKAIPENSGMAFVLVQHLDPKHESMLSELLQKVTTIPVLEITDELKVEPDHIYILPSNKMMVANDGVLQLTPRTTKKNERNMPVDLFFSSLAEVHQSHSIGVVLSGTASDGTKGLKAIKEHGGITFAQDDESAAYDGMPKSAVAAGVVDFILPPEKIPQKVLELTKITHGKETGEHEKPQEDEEVFRQILALLHLRKGTDFTYYKQSTIRRRILRRMALNKIDQPSGYLALLREKKHEQDVLFQDLLIPVTSFFRDSKSFDDLCEIIFPRLLKTKTGQETVRIWVAGCSTGQEVYSIAICLKEFLGEKQERVQIFATDISEPAIIKARSGIYTKSEVEDLSAQRLQEFFRKTDGSYQITKSIRDMCVFAVHNFLKDPPFGKLDFVSCRNVLIYMEPYLQKKAITTFHYALTHGGFLLLGKSENITNVSELFAPTVQHNKIFSRKDVPGRFMPVATRHNEQNLRNTAGISDIDSESPTGGPARMDFQKKADDIMLSKYTPAGVVVNEAMDIVHYRGRTGNYLEQLPGKPTHNLLKMAKEGLGFELRNIMHKVKKERASVIKEDIPLKTNGILMNIAIEAMPIPDTIEPYYLVLFHDNSSLGNKQLIPSQGRSNKPPTKKDDKDLLIVQLEQELAQVREDMRSITEDQEAVNEELQSANEELLSGSEELQSLNEEMETSKEELQSTNEELTVVNQELVGLNEQLTEARNYAQTIVATIREPLLVLNENLRIKSANSAFYKTFRINEAETEGRLIYELGNGQWNIPALQTMLNSVLSQKSRFENFEVTHNFPRLGERVMLLNALEMARENGEEKLILLAIEDITEKVSARKKIEASNKRYYDVLMQSPFAFCIMKGKEMQITVANNLMKEFWGKGVEVEGKRLLEVLPELRGQSFPDMIDTVYATGKAVYANEMLARLNHNGIMEDRYFNIIYQPHFEADETISGVISIAHEVTNQVLARKKVEESETRFKNLIRQAPVAMALFRGKDLMMETANQSFLQLIDKAAEDFVGTYLFESMPEARQLFGDVMLNVLKTGTPRYANESEFTINRFGKREKGYFNFVFQPIAENEGNITGVVCVANEVTDLVVARKRMEVQTKLFEDMLMTAPGFVATLSGPDHVYELVNEQYQSLFGKRKIQGKSIMTALPELEGQGFDKLLDRVYTTGQPYVGIDIPITLARDENLAPEERYFNFSYQPMYDENKNIFSILVFGYEVTDQVIAKNKNLESQQLRTAELEERVQQRTLELNESNIHLEEKNRELVKMIKELGSFSYVASHDLQEPLRKIRTFVNLIQEKEEAALSDKGKDYFHRIQESSSRMQTLIEDLLVYSHTSLIEHTFENTNVNIIIDEVIAELDELMVEKKAVIENSGAGEARINISQFRQVMHNLIGNALKFASAERRLHIVIKTEIVEGHTVESRKSFAGKKFCHIRVADNGIGFNAKYRDQIFEMFQRLHGQEEYRGTGIGLAIVKKIVENHGGAISASGELNKGAIFDIYIPGP